MSRISLGGGGAHLGGPGHPERAGARVQPRKGPTGAHPRSALLTATVPKLTPAKAGSPTNTCPGCGKLGPPGTGASPPGGWALGASPGSCCSPTHWQPWSSPASSCSSPLCRRPDGHHGLVSACGAARGPGPAGPVLRRRRHLRLPARWDPEQRVRPSGGNDDSQRGQPSVPLSPGDKGCLELEVEARPCGPERSRIQCPVIMALVANLLGAALSFTCIPASTKGASAHAQASLPGKPKASVFDLKAITQLLLQPGVLPVFLVKVICSLPSGLFMVMFSIISMDFFQLEASQAGYLMSFFGILQMVIQGLVIGRLSSHFSEDALLRASVLVFSVVGLAMALMANVFHFCLLMPGLVFSLCALNVVTDSMLTKAVSASDTGTMLGLCASVQPLTRTLGPTLGGLLYRHFGVPVFGHVQFVVNFVVFLVLWRQPTPPKMDKAR
ncbi:solute carrier family 22 member 18 isoform X10 [Hippopotamus amphibius kiboko]|uniref:solute carrier family 22 member 18 isoform X10 n=1 Tax=Hippopotamus amphibius kiboko TaxID=575201 RepID=UPI0025973656|nr:solute carrier family 22 member 18 isoform X10 [Hippopotamus amphibius kiboko]